ncbi:MAG TPA: N-methyl-D-aspartate receptor NMDAR2C subunit [Ramlibacter sp.]|nr:N-methyl-D-aspartate receptor NMDAR2C subunit [Ramlibacter sp.]
MNMTLASWQRLWGELGARETSGGLLNQLMAAYSEPQRRYHTLQHLRECLAHFEAAASLARRPAEVELALWFHDAVYDPQRGDNEERSADWAQASLLAAGCAEAHAERVAALVMVTKTHEPAGPPQGRIPEGAARRLSSDAPADDPDAALLLDIDLAILAASPARFDEYERQIRAEYVHVPEADFRARRAEILSGFLARERIYRTPVFHDALEARARQNLTRAVARSSP